MLHAITLLNLAFPEHKPPYWQIDAYASAAPDFVGSRATISDGQNVLRNGTNGWTCMPSNPKGPKDAANGWADAQEAAPLCFDDAGLDWMKGWMTGSKPVMKRDAFVWMLAGDTGFDNFDPKIQDESESDPSRWVASGPHLMLFPKDVASLAAFTTDFLTGAPYTMFSGTPYSHLMIPFPGYYDRIENGPKQTTVPVPNAPHNSAEWKIGAFSQAAPAFLATNATITDGNSTLRNGTNGWTCTASNPNGPADPEAGYASVKEAAPVCFDEAGLDWMKGWMGGSKPVMKRDAIVWMLAGDNGFDNSDPTKASANGSDTWVESGPHLMLFPKNPEDLAMIDSDFSMGTPYAMFAGYDFVHVMIPYTGYYDTAAPPGGLPPVIVVALLLVGVLIIAVVVFGQPSGTKAAPVPAMA